MSTGSFAENFEPVITPATGITGDDLNALGLALTARAEELGDEFFANGGYAAIIAINGVIKSLGFTSGLQVL